jgi:hypothetical protein
MGLTSKRIPIAMLKTFWYVKILPWFGISIASGLLLGFVVAGFAAGSAGSVMLLYPMMLYLLFIGVNLVLIARARRGAQEAFSKWANSAVV